MDNYAIADQFSLLARLMDIHGENSFKSKSYASAAFAIEKMPQDLSALPQEKIFQVKGIGESVGKKIIELLDTGTLSVLQNYIKQTPAGVLEMMNIKGLGPKKIHLLWKEMGIDTIEELQRACEDNRIAGTKGFGEKTQQGILDSIHFQRSNSGKYLYARLEPFAQAFTEKLRQKFPDHRHALTGEFRRQLEIVESLDWVTTTPPDALRAYVLTDETQLVSDRDGMLIVSAEDTLLLRFYLESEEGFGTRLFQTGASPDFLNAWEEQGLSATATTDETSIFTEAARAYLPPFLRETREQAIGTFQYDAADLVQTSSIKGLIHAHSNWSDGSYDIEVMARELIRLGFEYLVLSDHSKSAYYANGLTELRIRDQHSQIDELNQKLAPFKIFKSIECDILADGALDYENKILSGFDLVITSVHSNLDMDEDKAMKRLLGAITNPYTTIMGHLTGRLLLRRKGYPVDHRALIDACADHHVVIEINASPSRLDIDWRWIDYALQKGVYLSINPDAHTLEEFPNVHYGVLIAQKGGLPASCNLSSFSLSQFEAWLAGIKKKKGLS